MINTIKIVLMQALWLSLIYVGILLLIIIGVYYLIKSIKRDGKHDD